MILSSMWCPKGWSVFGYRVDRGVRDKQPAGEDTGPPYRGGNRGQAPNLYASLLLLR
ncbi:hypothetical protein KDK_44880 [Dictyobacter kobayashii]|uniref:Uncharacterized protein n=1 Tax=Dictyobacter kobayashii TaxID=2014872 RepID=A0A402ANB7_9CHLR|nr:hypothetical protein KDK_44880 [Dictyobacter kobayashii]